VSISIVACEKDEIPVPSGILCKALTSEQAIDGKPSIDEYLKTLPGNNTDEDLALLANWLLEHECVNQVAILCNSCLLSLPPQSHIRVFVQTSAGHTQDLNLFVLMSEPMEVMRID
jgi:hypothetical protein